jgi:hypothetical protein
VRVSALPLAQVHPREVFRYISPRTRIALTDYLAFSFRFARESLTRAAPK